MKCPSVSGVSLGIVLLALLKSSSSGPVSSGRAIATLDLVGSPGMSYSKKVTLALIQWIEEIDKCDGSLEVLYKNECNELASHYTPSCAPNQWLVLEKPKKGDRVKLTFPVKPKCVEMPCEFPTVWWGPLQKCIDIKDVEEVCGYRNVFRTDPFGDVHCDCAPAQGQLTEGADCHGFYQQGPCKSGEVLVYDIGSSLAKCAPDIYYNESSLGGAGEGKANVSRTVRATSSEKERKYLEQSRHLQYNPGVVNRTGISLPPNETKLWFTNEGRYARSAKDSDETLPLIPLIYSITDPEHCPNFDPKTNKCPRSVNVEPGSQDNYENLNRGIFLIDRYP